MITDDMELLCQYRNDLKLRRDTYNASVKGLKAQIAELEASITEQILASGTSITVGNLRAEYRPTVVFRMRKEKKE